MRTQANLLETRPHNPGMKAEGVPKEDFRAYVKLQYSGVTNMLDWLTASEYLGWDYNRDRERYAAIVDNYSELRERYPDVVADAEAAGPGELP